MAGGWASRSGRRQLVCPLLLQLLPGACARLAVQSFCWGEADKGGDCTGLNLEGIPNVNSNWDSFIAWDGQTGRKVCWGNETTSRQCRALDLKGTTKVHSTSAAFVALNEDAGTAQCWGDENSGGNCTGLNFTGVTELYSARYAFLAVNRRDGRALCWGDRAKGGSCPGLNLLGFDDVHSTVGVFLAHNRATGEVECWGSELEYDGGPLECKAKAASVGGLRFVTAGVHAWAGLGMRPGTGTCWGRGTMGEDCTPSHFANATEIYGNKYAFLTLDAATGEAHCWGEPNRAGQCPRKSLAGMERIFSSWGVFMAVNFSTGEHVCWGGTSSWLGGPPSACNAANLTGITDVITSHNSWVAIERNTSRMLCWGDVEKGGKCPVLPEDARIMSVHPGKSAFLVFVEAELEETIDGPDIITVHHWLWPILSIMTSSFLVGLVVYLHCRHQQTWEPAQPLDPVIERKASTLTFASASTFASTSTSTSTSTLTSALPWASEVTQWRSRSNSGLLSRMVPSISHLLCERAERLLARTALLTAGGPAYWGMTVQQLQDFNNKFGPEIEDYRRRHRMDCKFQHVCLATGECPCFHGDCNYRAFNPHEESLDDLKVLPYNMHLIVPLIIKTKTKDNLGIMGYWGQCNTAKPLKVNTFVSHCWNHDFNGFLHALSTLGPDTVVWVCSFALPQNIDINKVIGSQVASSPFASALTAAESVCLVVDESVEALTRSWCCFELYLTVTQRKALDIRAPIHSLETYQRILDSAKEMDVRRCTATNQADSVRILQALKGTEDAVNSKVRDNVEHIVRLLVAAISTTQSLRGHARASAVLDMDLEAGLGPGVPYAPGTGTQSVTTGTHATEQEDDEDSELESMTMSL